MALGLLGWAPSEFWRATPIDLAGALRGHLRAHEAPAAGPRIPGAHPAPLALTEQEVAEMQALLEADERGELAQAI